jgi:hypothetical protein
MKNLQRRATALAAALSLTAAPTARAFEAVDAIPWPSLGAFPAYPPEEGRPIDVWAHAGVIHDSNVLRTQTNEQSDNIARVGGGMTLDQRVYGRQRVRLDARADYYKYDKLTTLDHWAYALAGDWLWEIGNNLSGEVIAGYDRRQVDLGETLQERLDLVTTKIARATAGYLISPRFRLRGAVEGSDTDRQQNRTTNVRTTGARVGADYVSPLGNTIGLEYRDTKGVAPNAEFVPQLGRFVDNDFHERELSVVSTYALGTRLRSSIRLGHTRRDYSDVPERGFNDNTGAVTVDWVPGNKTVLRFEAYRFPRSIADVSASHEVQKGIAFGPRWAMTSKTVLSARLLREERVFSGDPGVVAGAVKRDEIYRIARFAFGWEPQHFWQMGVALDVGERDSNIDGRNYQYTAVMASLAYVW